MSLVGKKLYLSEDVCSLLEAQSKAERWKQSALADDILREGLSKRMADYRRKQIRIGRYQDIIDGVRDD